MSHPAEQNQADATHAGSSLTRAHYENFLRHFWAHHFRVSTAIPQNWPFRLAHIAHLGFHTRTQLQHWKYPLVKARLVKALNNFMDKTYGCGPFYDPADFPLVGPAQGYGELGEGTGQPGTTLVRAMLDQSS